MTLNGDWLRARKATLDDLHDLVKRADNNNVPRIHLVRISH